MATLGSPAARVMSLWIHRSENTAANELPARMEHDHALNQDKVVRLVPAHDSAQVTAAKCGDRQAFGRLYERYAPMVHGILFARVPGVEVDDLTHEVFLAALRQLHKLRKEAAFGAWLAQIARNRANDYYRRGPQRAESELPEVLKGHGDGSASAGAEAGAALRALRELPETYRETLILRLVEGMTGPEIAARTGLTPGSVRVNLHRGMKMLREKLGKKE
jgi:RNA polymerase sigma-70 factor (ECF subfamily)